MSDAVLVRTGGWRIAARAILGTASISGRLPITIPPVAQMGAGIQRTARPQQAPVAGVRP